MIGSFVMISTRAFLISRKNTANDCRIDVASSPLSAGISMMIRTTFSLTG